MQAKDRITDTERELVFTIADNYPGALEYIFQIRNMCAIGRDLDYIKILYWLKNQRIVGSDFLGFINDKCDGSILRLVAHARKEIHKDFKTRKVFAKRPI